MLAGKKMVGLLRRQLIKSTTQALIQMKGQEEAFSDRGGGGKEWQRWGERGNATESG